MITVTEADGILNKNILPLPARKIPLSKAYGMVLRENILASRDQQPADVVQMDGAAINLSPWKKGRRRFPIDGVQKAGMPALTLRDKNSCIEVMTGSLLPNGCDCVIRREDFTISRGQIEGRPGVSLKSYQYIRRRGNDYKKNQLLLRKGERLLARQIALAAAEGKAAVKVSIPPTIAIVTTGDELLDIRSRVKPHQFRRSNGYAIEAALNLSGFPQTSRFHLPDNKPKIIKSLSGILRQFDVVVLTGGVSAGKFDFLPAVFKKLGLRILFHKIRQFPGKPLLFARTKSGKPVFALPGNPVSAQIGTYRYLLPYLQKALDAARRKEGTVFLSEKVKPTPDTTCFLPVKIISTEKHCPCVEPIVFSGSGDYFALTKADGFIEIPAGRKSFPKGSAVSFFCWR